MDAIQEPLPPELFLCLSASTFRKSLIVFSFRHDHCLSVEEDEAAAVNAGVEALRDRKRDKSAGDEEGVIRYGIPSSFKADAAETNEVRIAMKSFEYNTYQTLGAL